jgi:hypothetical protein
VKRQTTTQLKSNLFKCILSLETNMPLVKLINEEINEDGMMFLLFIDA